MEELTEIEINILGDFKEQLTSIKKNINVSNKILEDTLEKTRLAEEVYNKTSEELSNKIAVLEDEVSSTQLFVKSETERIEAESALLESNKLEFTEYKDRTNLEIETKFNLLHQEELNAEETIQKYRYDIVLLDKTIKEKEQLISDIENKITTLTTEIGVLEQTHAELNEKISYLEQAKESILNSSKNAIDDKLKELSRLEELNEKEAVKTLDARLAHEERVAEFERKKAQLDIIYRRTKRAWEFMHPGQSLDNAIKI